jgi:hypothetical protein
MAKEVNNPAPSAGMPPRSLDVGSEDMKTTRIATDTSTIALFDLSTLEHKVAGDGDWWTYDKDEGFITELDNHNLYLINTGFDGVFDVEVISASSVSTPKELNSPSRQVYIVCGEELPGDGLRPECIRGGLIYQVDSARLFVSCTQAENRIKINIWSQPPAGGDEKTASLP